jgi:hypothetical protein
MDDPQKEQKSEGTCPEGSRSRDSVAGIRQALVRRAQKQLVDGALDREFLPGALGISSQAT